ncbi:MAG: nucleotidyltransferase family protein, partial [Chloroflexota bacterium]
GVWERSVAIDYHGHAARALCPSDLLLHLCIHLTVHLIMGRPSIVQLVDLLMVSRRMSNGDWSAVAQRARERNVTGYIYAALRLAHVVLAAPIPDGMLRDLANATPSHVRAHAETISLDDVMQRTQQPPLTMLRQRLLRGVQDRAETARWAGTIGERWNVWRTLLDVTRTDTGRMIGEKIRKVATREQ